MAKNNRPLNVPNKSQQTLLIQEERSEGPLPHPDLLAKFDLVVPGAAERIIRMAENESSHRHGREKSVTNANIEANQKKMALAEYQIQATFRSDMIGQLLGAFVCLCCVGGIIYVVIAEKNPLYAGTLALPAIAPIITSLRTLVQKVTEKNKP